MDGCKKHRLESEDNRDEALATVCEEEVRSCE